MTTVIFITFVISSKTKRDNRKQECNVKQTSMLTPAYNIPPAQRPSPGRPSPPARHTRAPGAPCGGPAPAPPLAARALIHTYIYIQHAHTPLRTDLSMDPKSEQFHDHSAVWHAIHQKTHTEYPHRVLTYPNLPSVRTRPAVDRSISLNPLFRSLP